MEERIWVKVEGVKLHSMVQASKDSEEEKKVWASVKIGSAFNVNGVTIHSAGTEKDWFRQNWALADARLLDVPILHKRRKTITLLDDALCIAVRSACYKHEKDLRPFIEERTKRRHLTLPFFIPTSWQKKSLRIPVDFVRIRNFQLVNYGNVVTTDIQIGHHLIFWRVHIYHSTKGFGYHDAPLKEERIQEKRLVSIINEMLSRKDIQREVIGMLKGNIIIDRPEFIESIEDCDPKTIPPPIRFY